MSTHTPGPWTANFRDGRAAAMYGHNVSSNIYSKPGVTSGQDAIVEVRGVTDEEARANARLIAAAPTLLDALQQIAWAADGGRQFSNLAASPALFESIRDMARAAIAKAEGTS